MNKINKGYTLTVKSWENDGDYPQTKTKTVATLEEAKVWYDMMQLCQSESYTTKTNIYLGNSYDHFDLEQRDVIINFLKENINVLCDEIIGNDEDSLIELFCELSSELLGSSEYYMCRAMESCVVTYSPVDVIPQIITF